MKITEPNARIPAHRELSGTCVRRDGTRANSAQALLSEQTLEIFINQKLAYRLVCTPTQLPELVLGRLLSEGIIERADEVDLLHICEEGYRAQVFLDHPVDWGGAADTAETVLSCCTGNKTLLKGFLAKAPLRAVQPVPYEDGWIFQLAEGLNQDMPIYRATHCAHSAMLMRDGEILARGEDIGRHNALDKVFGWALRNQVRLEGSIAYTSGRVPVDMAEKAIRAGVSILVSKAQPTVQAMELAHAWGLTLLCAAHPDSFTILTC